MSEKKTNACRDCTSETFYWSDYPCCECKHNGHPPVLEDYFKRKSLVCDICGCPSYGSYESGQDRLDSVLQEYGLPKNISLCEKHSHTYAWPCVHMAVALKKKYNVDVSFNFYKLRNSVEQKE